MKKIPLTVLMLFLTTHVYAAWENYGSSTDGTIYFYDKSSIKRSGNKVKVWDYKNFSADNEKAKLLNVGSVRTLNEINCMDETFKMIVLHAFPRQNLEGVMKDSSVTNPKIEYVVPESTFEDLVKSVCKK